MKRIVLIGTGVVVALGGLFALLAREELGKMELTKLPSRAGWQLPDKVISSLDLRPGDTVADIGSGDGYFAFYLAEAVGPNGTVYAVDVDADVLAELETEAERRGLDNVVAIKAETDDPLLPDGEIDLVFVCNAYHHIDARVAYFNRLRADLSAGGRLAIVEGKTQGLSRWVSPPGHGTSVADLRGELAAAMYAPEASFEFLPVQSLEIFSPLPM